MSRISDLRPPVGYSETANVSDRVKDIDPDLIVKVSNKYLTESSFSFLLIYFQYVGLKRSPSLTMFLNQISLTRVSSTQSYVWRAGFNELNVANLDILISEKKTHFMIDSNFKRSTNLVLTSSVFTADYLP